MALRSPYLGRIAHRSLRQRGAPEPGPDTAWARTANRIGVIGNLAGVAAVTGFIAALYPHVLADDCATALLAHHAIREFAGLYISFIAGALLGGAPHALIGFAALAARLGATAGDAKRATEERTIVAAWLRHDPLLFAMAAVLAAVIFMYGAGLLVQHVRARADWSANTRLRAEAATICAELKNPVPER